MDISVSQTCALRLATIVLLAANGLSICGQTVSSTAQPAGIAVSMSMNKDHVPTGQMPLAILTVKNLTDHEVSIYGQTSQVHVDGDNGEAQTTLLQRQWTGRLRPGERGLRSDENFLWTLAPGESGVRKLQLTYFYDLSTPGQYKVYAEITDPATLKRLLTNTATFEKEAPVQ